MITVDNYRMGAYAVISVLGLSKVAASVPPALSGGTEYAANLLKKHLKPSEAPKSLSEPAQAYTHIMGNPKYTEPPSSKALRYRLFQQTSPENRIPLNYEM